MVVSYNCKVYVCVRPICWSLPFCLYNWTCTWVFTVGRKGWSWGLVFRGEWRRCLLTVLSSFQQLTFFISSEKKEEVSMILPPSINLYFHLLTWSQLAHSGATVSPFFFFLTRQVEAEVSQTPGPLMCTQWSKTYIHCRKFDHTVNPEIVLFSEEKKKKLSSCMAQCWHTPLAGTQTRPKVHIFSAEQWR